MTVTTNERVLYCNNKTCLLVNHKCISLRPTAERYGYETYAEKAEKLNGRTAMLGFAAAVLSYTFSGSVFFFGAFGF